jgi:CRISPR-associated endonuclease/helicase Cas3
MLVCEAADELLAARGEASLSAAGLAPALLPRLEKIVRLGAFAHDLGKSSEQFQAMVRGDRTVRQLIRHEAASLWLCWPGQPLAAWLVEAAGNEHDLMIALVAAAGHHRKFWKDAIRPEEAGRAVALWTDHGDFAALLEAGGRYLGVSGAPPSERHTVELGKRNRLRRCFEEWEQQWVDIVSAEPENDDLARLAKALVLAADVAGSALPREKVKMVWIRTQLECRPTADELRAVAYKRLGEHSPRQFQLEVAASDAPVTFVRAGCGSGKTVAAYLWAAQHAGRQLWVTYPTTGTTTEGYRDYVAEYPDSRLEHGRREVDLEMFDLEEADRDRSEPDLRQRTRLEALGTWGAKVVVCTVDTVLGLVQNHRKGLYSWPGIASSALVFDEIHAYDDALFGALLRFLKLLSGIPVLLMTASLPAARLLELCELVRAVHGRSLTEISGPLELECLPRYRRAHGDPNAAARDCLQAGGKVLWVSNTVERSMAVVERFPGALVYHSRFRYLDRVERHNDVVSAFARPGPAIATTTQVAEMSLDLSADLLITDLAPVPAMVQRLGRLNRRAVPGADRVCPFVLVPCDSPQPYTQDGLDAAGRWLQRLGERALSQADLVTEWEAEPDDLRLAETFSAWADGGFSTEYRDLRRATPGLTVLREEDVTDVKRDPAKAAAYALPMGMPRTNAWERWPQIAYLPVAPSSAISYNAKRGGKWA